MPQESYHVLTILAKYYKETAYEILSVIRNLEYTECRTNKYHPQTDAKMKKYYLTYNSGAGIFGYCGESEKQPPFYFKGHAILFASRKEARTALKRYRELHGVTNLKPYAARHFAIVSADNALINNK